MLRNGGRNGCEMGGRNGAKYAPAGGVWETHGPIGLTMTLSWSKGHSPIFFKTSLPVLRAGASPGR